MSFDFPDEDHLKKIIMHTHELVWKNNITDNKIEKWLGNFNGEIFDIKDERKLALWLLCNFVYYNESETEHLCSVIMKKFIHYILKYEKREIVNQDVIKNIIEKTRFISLGRPSESGGLILYLFRLANDLQVKNFSIPSLLETTEIDYIVFLDDITISAGEDGQTYETIRNYDSKGRKIISLNLIASKDAVASLKELNVEVITAIPLDDRNKCFSNDSFIFHNHKEHIEVFKQFALHYGKKAKPNIPLGYNNSQLVFGFYYNTPDNTLPIFWGKENGWIPILKRVDKNYNRKVTFNERFI